MPNFTPSERSESDGRSRGTSVGLGVSYEGSSKHETVSLNFLGSEDTSVSECDTIYFTTSRCLLILDPFILDVSLEERMEILEFIKPETGFVLEEDALFHEHCRWNGGDATCLIIIVKNVVNYCKVCASNVGANSKHCGECNKCISDFDHHCQWLNNCIGKDNY